MSSVIIISGGMDSVSLLHSLVNDKVDIKGALSFNYGSKHNKYELPFAQKCCAKFGIPHKIIDLTFLNDLFEGSSSLLQSGSAIPHGHYAAENMKSTVVPFRNGILLSLAVGYAEALKCKEVYYGAHAGDHFIYPDCRPEFVDAINAAAQLGTFLGVNIIAPFSFKTKRDVALIGKACDVNFSETWSCYDPQILKDGSIVHCGKCGACNERKEALEGFDMTVYKD